MDPASVDIVSNAFGIDPADMASRVTFTFSAALLMFFVIAPVVGAIAWNTSSNWKNTILTMSVGALVALASNVALNWLLREIIPKGRLDEVIIGLIAATGAFALGWLAQRWVAFMIAPPGKGYYAQQEEALPEEDLLPFEIKRRAHMARRKHNLKR